MMPKMLYILLQNLNSMATSFSLVVDCILALLFLLSSIQKQFKGVNNSGCFFN